VAGTAAKNRPGLSGLGRLAGTQVEPPGIRLRAWAAGGRLPRLGSNAGNGARPCQDGCAGRAGNPDEFPFVILGPLVKNPDRLVMAGACNTNDVSSNGFIIAKKGGGAVLLLLGLAGIPAQAWQGKTPRTETAVLRAVLPRRLAGWRFGRSGPRG
jgi:hypothetical protein